MRYRKSAKRRTSDRQDQSGLFAVSSRAGVTALTANGELRHISIRRFTDEQICPLFNFALLLDFDLFLKFNVGFAIARRQI